MKLTRISHQISAASANSALSASSDSVGHAQHTAKYASHDLGRLPRIQSGLDALATKSDGKCGLKPFFLMMMVVGVLSGVFFLSRKKQLLYEKITLPKLDLKAHKSKIEEGKAHFKDFGCVRCHTFKGIGSPMTSSLSMLKNSTNPGFAKAWIEDPQRMKPGVKMEKTLMNEDQLTSLLYYLYESD